MRAAFDRRNGWTIWHAVGALAAGAVAVLVTGNSWYDMAHVARREEESSHVWLVPLVFVWLVWVRRSRLRTLMPGGRLAGTLLVGLGWFLWSFGFRFNHQSLWHAGAVVMVVGAVITVLGQDLLYRLLPAFCVLAFLIPVPKNVRVPIAGRLEGYTATITHSVSETLGMDVLQRGNLITYEGAKVEIAEACNGMRMVFTLFLACYVFAFVTPLRGYVRMIILLASPLTAVLCNVIRLVPTIWVFGKYTPENAQLFHDVSGWVMLVVAFLGLTGIVRLLKWAMVPVAPFTLAAA